MSLGYPFVDASRLLCVNELKSRRLIIHPDGQKLALFTGTQLRTSTLSSLLFPTLNRLRHAAEFGLVVGDRRHDAASRVELGCPHFAGIFSLGAAVDLIDEVGMANIQARALELNRLLTSGLTEDGWTVLSPLQNETARSAETLVQVEKPAEVVRHLFRRGVVVTEKPEGIRVATHFFNDEQDIERLIAGLNETRG